MIGAVYVPLWTLLVAFEAGVGVWLLWRRRRNRSLREVRNGR